MQVPHSPHGRTARGDSHRYIDRPGASLPMIREASSRSPENLRAKRVVVLDIGFRGSEETHRESPR